MQGLEGEETVDKFISNGNYVAIGNFFLNQSKNIVPSIRTGIMLSFNKVWKDKVSIK